MLRGTEVHDGRWPLLEAGICALSLFGSVTRGDARPGSDIDLAAEFGPAAKVDFIRMIASGCGQ
jgi:predicted nucleotidyltransferase